MLSFCQSWLALKPRTPRNLSLSASQPGRRCSPYISQPLGISPFPLVPRVIIKYLVSARPQSTRRAARAKAAVEPPEALPRQPIFEEEPPPAPPPASSVHVAAAAAAAASPAASGHASLAARPTTSYGSRLRSLLPGVRHGIGEGAGPM